MFRKLIGTGGLRIGTFKSEFLRLFWYFLCGFRMNLIKLQFEEQSSEGRES